MTDTTTLDSYVSQADALDAIAALHIYGPRAVVGDLLDDPERLAVVVAVYGGLVADLCRRAGFTVEDYLTVARDAATGRNVTV